MPKTQRAKDWVFWAFVAVPVITSAISTVHIVELFRLSNFPWMAILLAIAFEVGSLASLAALTVMERLKQSWVWAVFIILFAMQSLGNVYYAFDFVTRSLQDDPRWVATFQELVGMLAGWAFDVGTPETKMLLSVITGLSLPLVSIFMLKSLTDYLQPDPAVDGQPVIIGRQEPSEGPRLPAEAPRPAGPPAEPEAPAAGPAAEPEGPEPPSRVPTFP